MSEKTIELVAGIILASLVLLGAGLIVTGVILGYGLPAGLIVAGVLVLAGSALVALT